MVLPRGCHGLPALALASTWAALGALLAALDPSAASRVLLPAWGVGFAGTLIATMGPARIAAFGGREPLPRVLLFATVALLQLAALAGLAQALGAVPASRPSPFALAMAGAALIYVGSILRMLRAPRTRPSPVAPQGQAPVDQLVRWLDRATLAYLPVFALVALASPALLAAHWHLYLAGFVALTLQGCLLHLLPRFFHRAPPVALVRLLVPASIAGPALLALTLGRGGAPFALAAAVEATGLVAFACAILVVASPPARLTRPLYLTAALALAAGVALGVAFALAPPLRARAGAHAWAQLAGFVALGFLALTTDVAGPWARLGPLAWRRYVRVVRALAPLSVFATFTGLLLALDPLARAGWMLLALAYAAHAAGMGANLLPVAARRARPGARPRITSSP